MTDYDQLERLAREAHPDWSVPADLASYTIGKEDAAYIAACSPDQVLRLVAIARAAERALPALEMGRIRAVSEWEVREVTPKVITEALAALRAALSPEKERT